MPVDSMGNPEPIEYTFSLEQADMMGSNTRHLGGFEVTVYVAETWDKLARPEYQRIEARLIEVCLHTILLETLCVIWQTQAVDVMDPCEPCKLFKIADLMLHPDRWSGVEEHYRLMDPDHQIEYQEVGQRR